MNGWLKLRVGALLLVVGLLVPFGVAAQDGEAIPSFDVWLQAMSGPLVGTAVALLLSVAAEHWSQFEALSPKSKRVVYFGLCMVLPLVAASLRALLGYVPWSFDPLLWHALWNGFGAAGVGTLGHTFKLPNA
jgi:hypothetical protein